MVNGIGLKKGERISERRLSRILNLKDGEVEDDEIILVLKEDDISEMFRDNKSWYNPDASQCISIEAYERYCLPNGECKIEVKDRRTFDPFILLHDKQWIACEDVGKYHYHKSGQALEDQKKFYKELGVL